MVIFTIVVTICAGASTGNNIAVLEPGQAAGKSGNFYNQL